MKLKLQSFGHLMWGADSLEKTLYLGKMGWEKKGATEDEMVGWHHWLNGHECEQTPGDSEGQGSLACCNSWGGKMSDKTWWLNNNSYYEYLKVPSGSSALQYESFLDLHEMVCDHSWNILLDAIRQLWANSWYPKIVKPHIFPLVMQTSTLFPTFPTFNGLLLNT